MKRTLAGLALVIGGLAVVFNLPSARDPVDLSYRAAEVPPLAEVETWLAEREAAVPNLRPPLQKRIVWAGDPGTKTDLSVVYIHGYSASPNELRPVPDQVAATLGANLHFTRLTGHGRDGDAMAEPRVRDWADDVAEALAVGRTIGDRVLIMGTSMGGALTTAAALDPDYMDRVAGIALFAPAYKLPAPGGVALAMPYVRQWGPLVMGQTREIPARSEAQAASWTLTYPFVSVVPLGALVAEVGAMDKSQGQVPALFFYSQDDTVVVPEAIEATAQTWGGPSELVPLTMGPGDDENAHVIAGDIMSPGQTETVVTKVVDWARGL